jgi:septal ring factor EnvC (AmiA/AmiB activator)
MAKTPYFNKRRWLEGRQDEITELYRTGKSWREIIEHLKIAYAMPFALTEADFFKYCDFLLDEVATSHLEENIELQQQLSDFKKQFSRIEKAKVALQQEYEALKEKNIKLTARLKQFIEESQEQDQFFEELQVTNSEQANKLIQQINLNKQLEQSSAALSRKNEQQGDKLEKISKYMPTIQAEMDKFSKSEHDYTQQITKQKNTIFRLKAMLTVLLVILLGFAFKSGLFA